MKKLFILLTLLATCCISVNAEPSTTGQTKTGTENKETGSPPTEGKKVIAKRQNVKAVTKKTNPAEEEKKNPENTATEKKN